MRRYGYQTAAQLTPPFACRSESSLPPRCDGAVRAWLEIAHNPEGLQPVGLLSVHRSAPCGYSVRGAASTRPSASSAANSFCHRSFQPNRSRVMHQLPLQGCIVFALCGWSRIWLVEQTSHRPPHSSMMQPAGTGGVPHRATILAHFLDVAKPCGSGIVTPILI